ncbi:MAG: hypothetical protein GY929_12985 [Actinomycetia bacterium]|nr:hypothetical protein [Actinomycetes bacterium]
MSHLVGGGDVPTADRRRFLKVAAGAGVGATVWSEPIIRGVPAYAASAGSVNGSCTAPHITWSSNKSKWENRARPRGTTVTVSGSGTCPPTATWVFPTGTCGTLTEDVTVMATGSLDTYTVDCFGDPATPGCPSTGGATVAITTGASCTFANVTPTSVCGAVVITHAPDMMSFLVVNSRKQGHIGIDFDIIC